MRSFYSNDGELDPLDLNVAQQVVVKIDQMIGTGILSPGERLVEAKLAADLGVSRIPIREALRILAGDGVVELVRNSGARVTLMTPARMQNMFRVQVGLLIVGLDQLAEIDDITPLVRKLREQVDLIENARASRDGLIILKECTSYQEMICTFSDNEYLSSLVGKAHFGNFSAQVFPFVPMSVILKISQCYRQMTSQIEKRNLAGAGNTLKKYTKYLDESFSHVISLTTQANVRSRDGTTS